MTQDLYKMNTDNFTTKEYDEEWKGSVNKREWQYKD